LYYLIWWWWWWGCRLDRLCSRKAECDKGIYFPSRRRFWAAPLAQRHWHHYSLCTAGWIECTFCVWAFNTDNLDAARERYVCA
jgi:hypothetical protein